MTINPYLEQDTEGNFLVVLPLEKLGPYSNQEEAEKLMNHIHYFSTSYNGSFEDPDTYEHSRDMALYMYEVLETQGIMGVLALGAAAHLAKRMMGED